MRSRGLLIIATALTLAACSRTEALPEKPPRPVQTAAVEMAPAPRGVRYSATIAPFSQVPVAFKTSGYVDSLLQVPGPPRTPPRDIQAGDLVRRGAVLARVQQTDYRARLQQAEARVAQTDASIVKAQADLARAEQLFAARSLTQQDLDAARLAHDSARAQVTAARADVELARSALQDTTLTAPLAAVVLEKRIERGALASPGSVAFVLGDVRTVKAVFGVPDTIVRALAPGQQLSLVSDALPGRPFDGRITAIAPAADPQTRVFNVEVTIPNADSALKPGMIATVQVDESPATSRQGGSRPQPAAPFTVPLASIVKNDASATGYAVFIVDGRDGQDVARLRPVTVGDVVGNAIEVASGVRAGERVITTGATLVKDGEPVKVIP